MDTAPYTHGKSNQFNGIKLPSYAIYEKDMPIKVIKQYNYDTFYLCYKSIQILF